MGKNEETSFNGKEDTAGVIAPPPLIFLAFVLLGLLIHRLSPRGLIPEGLSGILGPILVVLSLSMFFLAVRQFKIAKTSVKPHEPTTTIITSGPYMFSRNPIYLAMAIQCLGVALWVNSIWLMGTLILAIVVITIGVIFREERYLERKFGHTYLNYKTGTRRWL